MNESFITLLDQCVIWCLQISRQMSCQSTEESLCPRCDYGDLCSGVTNIILHVDGSMTTFEEH